MFKSFARWGGYGVPTEVPDGMSTHVAVGGREIPRLYEVVYEPYPEENRPGLTVLFEVRDGRPQTRRVVFEASEWGREVLRTDLDFALEDLLERVTLYVGQNWNDDVTHAELDDDKQIRAIREARKSGWRRGPSDEQLRKLVDVYRANPKAQNKAASKEFGIHERTTALWAAKAREKGFFDE